ncbi:MAG: energy-coupling factor transporter transmembrane protein EcfT [Clostridia bacterium]|nr:energy-coupling factor transporter transmembrane protein EcfT [Clostridia bacterium]
MSFFKYKNYIYPLFVAVTSAIIIVFGLIEATYIRGLYFLAGVYVWLLIFGCWKTCLKTLPVLIIAGGIFYGIGYLGSKNHDFALAMVTRFYAVIIAVIPGMSIEPTAITRNLSQLKVPRFVTLGVLIMYSFVPVLRAEIKRVHEAMKTRGTGSILNPKIFYRAFLIPLVTRIVDISDILALSIETRGFTLGKTKYTVYKKEYINIFDVLFVLGIITGVVLTVVL